MIANALKSNHGNVENVINEYLDDADKVCPFSLLLALLALLAQLAAADPVQFKRKYGWDEAAFSSGREDENTSGNNANIPGGCSFLLDTGKMLCADDTELSFCDTPACHLRHRAQEFLGRTLTAPLASEQPIAYEPISRCHRPRVYHGRPEQSAGGGRPLAASHQRILERLRRAESPDLPTTSPSATATVRCHHQ